MPPHGDDFVSVSNVRAISDGVALMCELRDGRRFAVPLYDISMVSEVRHPGDSGTLTLRRKFALEIGLAGPSAST